MIRTLANRPLTFWLFLTLLAAGHLPAGAAEPRTLTNSTEYFPDAIGNRWQYQGQVIKTPLQRITRETFHNVSTVTGTERIEGIGRTPYRWLDRSLPIRR